MTRGSNRFPEKSRATQIALPLCSLLALLYACRGHTDRVADLSDAPVDRDAKVDDSGSREAFCAGMEPVLAAAGSGCLDQIASQTFRYAVCSCTHASALGTFSSDSFDSSVGPYAPSIPPTRGAAIGVNGSLVGGGLYDIGGSLTVGGSLAGPIAGVVRGDLRVSGPVSLAGGLEVTGNAWIADSLMAATGWLLIDGDLTQGVGMPRDVTPDSLMIKGQDLREQVPVTLPCARGKDELLDVAAIVADAKTHNHNSDAAFEPGSLTGSKGDERLELPCGKLLATALEAGDTTRLTLVLRGRTSLFIDGDLKVKGTLTFELGPDADVDVFVSGNYTISGTQAFSMLGAGHIRFYVAGDQRIELSKPLQGTLYAPHADVVVSGVGEVYGAIFANSLTAPGSVAIHYDRSILRAGDRCEPQAVTCQRCDDCNSASACVAAECSACGSDSDCCQPLVCRQGQCVSDL
jgi:cytoskeletal protein CcmA (bactofilin family)